MLQERYSGCSVWFEELRKKRVSELRKELEKSEESIGSLETKLETLKSEKAVCSYADYGCSAAESSEPLLKSGINESAGKETSRDGSSAGSFTEEVQTNGLPLCQAATTDTSVEESERKPVVLEPFIRPEKFPSIVKLAEIIRLEHGVNIRKRRGKRRRKEFNKDRKDGSVGENNLMISSPDFMTTTSQAKENLTGGYVQPVRSPDANDQNPCSSKQGMDDFVGILDSIMENEHACVFRRRLDSQKRARYKRIIRQHMDLDTIRSRIVNKSITSTAELLRDLLLLANNALVFYSKSTREYKCALVLRDLVTKVLRQHYKSIGNKVAGAETPKSLMCKLPAKPRSARPFNSKSSKKAVDKAQGSITTVSGKVYGQPPSIVGSPSSAESSALTKKTQGKRGKVECVRRGNAGIQAETPMKVRKRARVK